jgi:UDP-N-acetylmuramoyl-tripeptide--D-alanyl-D-alanine ligase
MDNKKHRHAAACGDRCNCLTLGKLIEWSGGRSSLLAAPRSARVACVWNDSRKVTKGDVFLAIATGNDDGHRYVRAAFRAGAAAAIVGKKAIVDCDPVDRKKLIVVDDPLRAVERAAAKYRKELDILLIGITGSSGKTTTRSFIASVLKQGFPVGETYTNWNNHIGVPLSILRFEGTEWAGVIEMGANHENEIGPLSKIAAPDIAVITNIGYAHVGLFGSLAATTRAKFEIAVGLNKKDGFLLLNGDDDRLVAASRRLGRKTVLFGTSSRCDVRPERVEFHPERGLSFILDGCEFHLPVPGRHFLYSALPAIFLGRRCGIPDERIASALAAQKPLALRGGIERKLSAAFIVDCYNANPSSMKSAIATLVEIAPPKHRVAIVGDMRELGRYSKKLHIELGVLLAESKVDRVIAVGEFAREVAAGAKKGGMPSRRIVTAMNAVDAVVLAKKKVSKSDVVLIKGSRGIHLETVFENF